MASKQKEASMSEERPSKNLLGERQRTFMAFVLCFAGVLLLACLLSSVIFILNQAFVLFSGVIWSLALSAMLAILLRPVVGLLEEKLKMGTFSFHYDFVPFGGDLCGFGHMVFGRKSNPADSRPNRFCIPMA